MARPLLLIAGMSALGYAAPISSKRLLLYVGLLVLPGGALALGLGALVQLLRRKIYRA